MPSAKRIEPANDSVSPPAIAEAAIELICCDAKCARRRRLERAVTSRLCLAQLAFDALQDIGQLRRMIRLGDEFDVRGHFIPAWLLLTRADHNDRRRPATPDVMGQC